MKTLRDVATRLSGEIARLGPFELLCDGGAISDLEKNPPAQPTVPKSAFAH